VDEIAATKSQSGSGSEVSLAEYPFLTAFEIDLICEGRKQNAAKARHLESLSQSKAEAQRQSSGRAKTL
jgi:hypothetical protein